MKKNYKRSLFIFRRDFRLQDNTGFIKACKESESIIPCFIFDPRQVSKQNNYRSMNAIQFMVESLHDLEKQLKTKKGKLYLFYGIAEKIVEKIIKKESVEAVFLNCDYTPFSLKRDKVIEKICLKHNITFNSSHDIMLHEPELVKTKNNTPYSVFSAYYKSASKLPIAKCARSTKVKFYTGAISDSQSQNIYKKIIKNYNADIHVYGGRTYGSKILRSLKKFKNYAKERDFPAIPTTNLSAYLKFGVISIRETYYAIVQRLGKNHPLIRQLYWHDFWIYVAYHSPFVYGHAYHKKYDKLWWSKSKKSFEAWNTGATGFPIVDAGMRQLNKTGFMHNRVRMIVASFLTKDLHINWLWGEKYFAQQLVDYDPAINNGNWQWCASTGCDPQPYFRIFNPWLQQKKFDPECAYIKQWIPELDNIEPKIIHTLFKPNAPEIKGYPQPIIDHAIERKKALALYKKV